MIKENAGENPESMEYAEISEIELALELDKEENVS